MIAVTFAEVNFGFLQQKFYLVQSSKANASSRYKIQHFQESMSVD